MEQQKQQIILERRSEESIIEETNLLTQLKEHQKQEETL